MGLLLPLSSVREIAYFLFPTCFSSFLMFPISLPLSFLCSSFFAFHPYYFPLFLALALFLFSYCFLELSAENWWLWLVDQFTAIDMWVWVQWGIWQSLLLPTCWQDGEIWSGCRTITWVHSWLSSCTQRTLINAWTSTFWEVPVVSVRVCLADIMFR